MKRIQKKRRTLLGMALVVVLVIGSMLAAPMALAGGECLLDLPGDTCTVDGFIGGEAIFEFFNPGDPTGSGVFDPFVRINANTDEEQGYNTSGRKLQFDENNSPNFTKDYEIGWVPLVEIGGKMYREFQCDVNQNNKKGDDFYISLDQLEFYMTNTAGLLGYDFGTNAVLKWQMNDPIDGDPYWIKINSLPNAGSGRRDFRVLIPAEDLVDAKFVILFSQFGTHYPNNGGYEEWGVRLLPGIDVVKYVSVDGGVTWDDANVSPGPAFYTRDNPVQFKIVVTNTGRTTLNNIELTDTLFKGGSEIATLDVPNIKTLDPGESVEILVGYTASGCSYENVVEAVGVCAESDTPVQAVDSAWFRLIE